MSKPIFDQDTKASDLVRHYAASIVNKTILVTGVSPSGLGDSFIRQIAPSKPAKLILAGRLPTKFQKLIDKIALTHPEIEIKSLELDLASFSNVRKAAEMTALKPKFQTCHLGHFLFTNLIMNKILASKEPRIVNISSNGHRLGTMRWTDYNFSDGKYYEKWAASGQAKTANILMGISLAEKLGDRGLLASSIHPGGIMTDLGRPRGTPGRADYTPHTAFVDPQTPEGAKGRQSIEVRCLVFYEDEA
ncbi:Short-chain dehydrogenase TIC 32 like protein [Verticillium longisporum]|nr:Short-chain dehydrogenase TIC 32 like protein [Verticillium longisporum]